MISEAEYQSGLAIALDLQFLLSPEPWEAESSAIVECVGQQLAEMRHRAKPSGRDLAKQIDISLSTLEGMERGDTWGRGGTFPEYLRYNQCELEMNHFMPFCGKMGL